MLTTPSSPPSFFFRPHVGYLLTRKEGKVGTPEKPLSDLGLLSYRAYWKDIILEYLEKYRKYPQVSFRQELERRRCEEALKQYCCMWLLWQVSISRLSQETGINTYDIISTLQSLSMVKYWRGKHVLVTQAEVEAEHKLRQKRRPVQIGASNDMGDYFPVCEGLFSYGGLPDQILSILRRCGCLALDSPGHQGQYHSLGFFFVLFGSSLLFNLLLGYQALSFYSE